MADIEQLLEFSSTYLSDQECEEIKKAYLFAKQAHQGQKRVSGEPYIIHPVSVALILAHYYLDALSLQAALLHDVLEDTPTSKETLSDLFGEKVADLVDGVSKLKRIQFESKAHEQAENLRKMMFAVAHDIRVLLIKLADRLHNMRTLSYMSEKKQRNKAQETIEIYAPIAHRLGMNTLKKEFEDIGMQVLYPWRYKIISAKLALIQQEQEEIEKEISQKVQKALVEQKINFQDFFFRRKNIYSIYKKMQRKNLKFHDITDIAGFRVLVYSTQDCYRLLGILHSLFRPILSKFKDYIAIPKANGYQSLHTTIITEKGVPIEFQIRTIQMDAIAQKGVAAHWVYKNDSQISETQNIRAYQWIKNVIDLQKTSRNPIEFIENMKIDLNPEEVYIFDEKSNIWTLPRGSTPVDLAYVQDIERGNTCAGARIDNKFMPLSTVLKSGQKVEILTSTQASPSPNWLSFAISGRARAHIRSYLCNQQSQHALQLGSKLLEKDLVSMGSSLKDFENHFEAHKNSELFGHHNAQKVLVDVGMGRLFAHEVAQRFCQVKPGSEDFKKQLDQSSPVSVQGSEKFVLAYASCCYPIPNDKIVGYRQPGEGLVIHRQSCTQLCERQIQSDSTPLIWEPDPQARFKTQIHVRVRDDIGSLAVLAQAIALYQSNIISILATPTDIAFQNITVVLTVKDSHHLESILKKIRSLDQVHHAERA